MVNGGCRPDIGKNIVSGLVDLPKNHKNIILYAHAGKGSLVINNLVSSA